MRMISWPSHATVEFCLFAFSSSPIRSCSTANRMLIIIGNVVNEIHRKQFILHVTSWSLASWLLLTLAEFNDCVTWEMHALNGSGDFAVVTDRRDATIQLSTDCHHLRYLFKETFTSSFSSLDSFALIVVGYNEKVKNTTKKIFNGNLKWIKSKSLFSLKIRTFIVDRNFYFIDALTAWLLRSPIEIFGYLWLRGRRRLEEVKLTSTKNFYNFSFRLLSAAAAVADSSHHRGKRKSARLSSRWRLDFM